MSACRRSLRLHVLSDNENRVLCAGVLLIFHTGCSKKYMLHFVLTSEAASTGAFSGTSVPFGGPWHWPKWESCRAEQKLRRRQMLRCKYSTAWHCSLSIFNVSFIHSVIRLCFSCRLCLYLSLSSPLIPPCSPEIYSCLLLLLLLFNMAFRIYIINARF